MKNRFITAAMLLGMMALSSSCVVRVNSSKLKDELDSRGSLESIDILDEETATKVVNLKDFNEIASKGAFDVYFVYSDEPKAEIVASKDIIDNVVVAQKGNKVTVNLDRKVNVKSHGVKTTVRLYAPSVKSISLAGSGNIEAETIHEPEFSAAVAGSGDIVIYSIVADEAEFAVAGAGDVRVSDLEVKELEAAVAGSGDIVLNGHAGRFEGDIAGSGDIDIRGLDCDNAKTDVKGGGKVMR
ncbi:MAG: DUF2807 domain-containing protein [Bacteroidales bacterium]|nr:DUF2807 domain-containing protein [Bacteroidales bacterium]